MTADPNDSKGAQQVPATDVAAILPSDFGQGPAAQLLLTLAQTWADASGHRGKGRPAELSDIPPASMRHMAGVLRGYAKQLDSAAAPAVLDESSFDAVSAARTDVAAETVTTTVVDSTESVVLDFVMAEAGPFGPPGAYVDAGDDDDEHLDRVEQNWPWSEFGPPGAYADLVETDDVIAYSHDGQGNVVSAVRVEVTEAPKA